MSNRNQMNRTLIETARAIAAEQPPAGAASAAAVRVQSALAAATADGGAAGEPSDASSTSGTLTSCADYQARMPALVAGTLPEAQRLLVEDHSRECIPCRKHLQAVRAGRAVSDWSGPAAPARVGRYYAAAAAVVAVAAAGVWTSQRVLQPPQDGIVQVQNVDGRIFVAGSGDDSELVPLAPGDAIDGGDRIRTGAGSRGVFELVDGSRIEAAGLTTFRVDARRRGDRIRVDRGSVIVQAAEQANRSLVVSTEEMLVSVKGTIFAVTHGVKGSRVSVIEGEVEVEKGRERHSLLAGDQLRSRPTLIAMTLQEEVGWSQDADRYLAVLEEFKSLRSQLNQLMDAAPARHSTRLLDLMPSDTRAYLAMPNAPATLGDLFELVRSRIESSELLAEWWAEFEASDEAGTIEDVVGALRGLGDAMGDETVVAVVGDLVEEDMAPLAVTEVTDSAALREAIEGHLAELARATDEAPVNIVDDLETATEEDEGLVLWIADDIAAASTSLDALRTVAANREGAANPFVGSRLHGRLAQRYAEGAELLAAVDLAGVISGIRDAQENEEDEEEEEGDEDDEDVEEVAVFAFTGLDRVQDLVVARTQDGDRANLTAALSFDGERSGMVSWLAEPGANGALEFFSPDTSFVSAGVIEDPLTIYDELTGFLSAHGIDLDEPLAEVEAELGLSLRDDLLQHVGGEYAAGIDGPVLPVPAWKAVAAVYDADALQSSIEVLVDKAAEVTGNLDGDGNARLVLDEQESGGRTVYRLGLEVDDGDGEDDEAGEGDEDATAGAAMLRLLETPEIFYTYFDGYMVSASNVATIDTAIRYRGSGASLTSSQDFLDLLPENGYADFSAMVYNRLAETASELFDLLPTEVAGDDQQAVVQAIEEQLNSQGPALYTVYAGQSEIVVTSSGPSLLAFTGLGPLFGLPNLLEGLESMEDAVDPEPEAETGPVDVVAGLAAGALFSAGQRTRGHRPAA
ncbi:MAG: FecR family protein [Acidobacteria bacterium]|nr:FecR family protein [Acidobacteriota bacterium]